MGTVAEDEQRRLRLAFDLSEAALVMMRQNLRRRFPDAPPEELEKRLGEWLAKPPDHPRSHFRRRAAWLR